MLAFSVFSSGVVVADGCEMNVSSSTRFPFLSSACVCVCVCVRVRVVSFASFFIDDDDDDDDGCEMNDNSFARSPLVSQSLAVTFFSLLVVLVSDGEDGDMNVSSSSKFGEASSFFMLVFVSAPS